MFDKWEDIVKNPEEFEKYMDEIFEESDKN